jgi:hypothetical protein
MLEAEVKRDYKRINEKLTTLMQKKTETQKITLVKMGIIRELTGLDKEGLRKARENNLLIQVKRPDGIWYELETMHPRIIKQEMLFL